MSNLEFLSIPLIILCALVATAVIFFSYKAKKDALSPGVFYTAVYFYATLGPILAITFFDLKSVLMKTEKIPASMVCFLMAFVFLAFGLLLPKRSSRRIVVLPERYFSKALFMISIIVWVINLFGMLLIVLHLDMVLQFSKGLLLSVPSFSVGHRMYLLFAAIVLPVYAVIATKADKRGWFSVNVVIYICYGLLTQERDFVLFALTLVLIRHYFIKRFSVAVLGFGVLALLSVFSGLFALRAFLALDDGESVNAFVGLLAQGSNAVITTNIIEWIDAGNSFLYGVSYLQSLINLLPSFVYRVGTPLSEWFVQEFFPTSGSGYGFSVEGEAFLNGGYIGIALVFFMLGYFLDKAYRNMLAGSFLWSGFYFFFLPFLVYATRGDSLMLFKGSFMAFSFLLFFYVLVTRGKVFYKTNSVTIHLGGRSS